MKIERESSRMAVAELNRTAEQRQQLQRRFENLLHYGMEQGQDDEAGSGDAQQQSKAHQQARSAVVKSAIVNLQRALHQDTANQAGTDHYLDKATTAALLKRIEQAVKAGQRHRAESWRLIVRVPDKLLAHTEIEVAFNDGSTHILLRTSSEQAYRQIVASLPTLDQRLRHHSLQVEPVQALLVNRLDWL